MRAVRLSAAISLDGYIAATDGSYDWIVMDPDIDFGSMMRAFDSILMGRKSYEITRQHGGAGMPGMDVYVISQTLRQEDCEGVTVSNDPAATVAALRQTPGKDIWLFGGGELFRSMLELQLVDSIEVAVIPVLLGGGIPLLPHTAPQVSLKLTAHRLYARTGTVLLEYAIVYNGK